MDPKDCAFTILLILILILSTLSFFSVSEGSALLWPQPQVIEFQGGPTIFLSKHFTIHAPKHRDLLSAAKRYSRLIEQEQWLPMSAQLRTWAGSTCSIREATGEVVVHSLEVMVVDLSADLQHGVDESYKIVVDSDPGRAELTAQTVWGAMRGMETFSQLVRRCGAAAHGDEARLIIEGHYVIDDYPFYSHRGILLDVSRNFYPVKDIRRTIRALSFNKLNVLHLHITDSHSFPLELELEPGLSREGSYGPRFVYSKNDVKGLVDYGRRFGVRLVPEIDTPGHALSWGGAYPEIVTCLNKFWDEGLWADRFASEPGAGQLNPLHPKTYEVVKNVITEVASLFPDNLYHAGGDEVSPSCWLDNELVRDYINSSSTHSLGDLLAKFINETRPYIEAHNKTVVYWEDVLLHGTVNVSESVLPKETTILQTWNNGPINTKTITAAGYRTIVSSSDFFYLDCGHGGWVGNDPRYDQDVNNDPTNTFNYGGNGGSWCAPFKTWARIYDYDIAANLTREEMALVIGGEVTLWSEQADETVLDARLWPRSSALAEILWSGNRSPKNPLEKRYAEAIVRLNDWRYRMVHRGIAAEPLQPLWCLKYPEKCGLVP